MLHQIAERFKTNQELLEDFFQRHQREAIPPIYLSCDIRHSGKKMGIIDTNLFPAGFNNLCDAYGRRTTEAFKNYFNKYYPNIDNIILLSEEHTRNRYYLENIFRLQALLSETGLNCEVAYAGVEIQGDTLDLPLNGDRTLHMEKLRIEGGKPRTSRGKADLILSNNDFSQGLPTLLEPISDTIIPHPRLGWYHRRKSDHFKILKELIIEFSRLINLDPWLLYGLFQAIQIENLSPEGDLPSLANGVAAILKDVQNKYIEFHIEDPPYVFIKNDAGTYGMGLLEVSSGEEVLQLNRRKRNKLLSTKGKSSSKNFLIQEGIPTADFYSDLPIEPVIYMVGWETIGGFFRMNTERDALTSLNTRGMIFSCLCLHKLDEPHEDNYLNCAEKENLVYLSNVMAKIAALAAAKENQKITQD